MSSDGDYDWNVRARLIEVLHKGRQSAEDAEHSFTWPEDEIPVNDEELPESLVSQHKLNHGDILRFDEERFTNAFIVSRDGDGKYRLLENPDESGAGYLTIPNSVLARVTDAVAKYNDIMELNCLILHLSPNDQFVQEQLGKDVPEGWKIDAEYVDGVLEAVHVSYADAVWECQDWSQASLVKIKEYFAGTKALQTKLLVKLDLKDEKFSEYKTKHGQGKKFAWVAAFPKLPGTWAAEKGASGMGASHYKAEWKCKGPQESKDTVMTAIKDFFDGFETSIEEQ